MFMLISGAKEKKTYLNNTIIHFQTRKNKCLQNLKINGGKLYKLHAKDGWLAQNEWMDGYTLL